MPLTREQTDHIAYSIGYDRPNLFSLADKVLTAAPSCQWGTWVIDACGSYFLAQFMGDIYTAHTQENTPRIVHIANSRFTRNNQSHQQAVRQRLAQPDLAIAGRRALILCEYTKSRGALSTLCEPLRQAGATAVDAAVLCLETPGRYDGRPSAMPDTILEGEPRCYEPSMFMGPVRDAVGQQSIPGLAEPRDLPNVDHELKAYVSNAFRNLAHEYAQQRLS